MKGSQTLVSAARCALDEAMEADPRVLVLGEDVASGGPFTLTRGLADRHGVERVKNTPISEGAFMGAGIGLALAGARPFVDVMFDDFITAASDQLFNHAAKIRLMSGGRASVPLTVWTLAGAHKGWGAQHSQNLAGWLTQVPGLKVLSPVTPNMMYAATRAALADPDPVVLVADRALLFSRKKLDGDDGSPWSPRIVQLGSDVTVVAAGRSVHFALEAATLLPDVSIEVIDLNRLAPLDLSLVVSSIKKTGRVVVAYDETGGALCDQIAARLAEEAFWDLDGPVRRIASDPIPVPGAASLEAAHQISPATIVAAIESLVDVDFVERRKA